MFSLVDTTIFSNFAGNANRGGGGIFSRARNSTISSSAIGGNTTNGQGGGIVAYQLSVTSMTVIDSFISGNSADGVSESRRWNVGIL
jgi:hypothetical protein